MAAAPTPSPSPTTNHAGEGRLKAWMGPVASAILLALAFAGAWPLAFVALVPWLASLRGATPRQAWNRGYAFGLLFSLTQLWWLGSLAYVWLDHNLVLAALPWLLASLLSAVYYGLLGRLVRSCNGLNAVWAIPLVWAGMEAFRSYIPVLAFPWSLLAEPLIAVPRLAGPAWFGTIYLVSALVVVANVVALKLVRDGAHRSRWVVGELLLGLAFVLLGAFPAGGESLATVAAGQPGVDNAFDEGARTKEPLAIGSLIERLPPKLDLVVLPEGVAQMGDSQAPPFPLPETPLVFGAERGAGPVYQSAFAHDAKGWTVADKTRLVIFGEFVPGRDVFPFLQDAFHLPGGDLSAGDKLATVRAGRLTVGPLICFEGLFPDLGLRQAAAGADLLAVMSIDDWFAPVARERLARAAQWRAVEAGLPLVRAGSLGRSMIVSPRGEVLADVPYGGPGLVVAKVPHGRGPFPLVWLFPAVALGSLVIVPFLARRAKARTRSV